MTQNLHEFRPPSYMAAISSLRPNSSFTVTEDRVVIWRDPNNSEPSTSEIEAEYDRMQAAWTAYQYGRDRKSQYPAVGDQLDDLYRKGAFSDEMAAKLKAVKDANPKG